MADLADLAKRMKKLAASLESEASRCALEVAEALVDDLAHTTPVDTSAALSNWLGALESPNMAVVEPHLPGHKGSTRLRSANGTVEAFKIDTEKKKPGQAIFISNSINYIRRLDEGSSKQQPAGFVHRSVLIARKKVKNFKMKLE